IAAEAAVGTGERPYPLELERTETGGKLGVVGPGQRGDLQRQLRVPGSRGRVEPGSRRKAQNDQQSKGAAHGDALSGQSAGAKVRRQRQRRTIRPLSAWAP